MSSALTFADTLRGFLCGHLNCKLGASVQKSFPTDDHFHLPGTREAQLAGINDVMRRRMKRLRSVLVLAQRLVEVLVANDYILDLPLVAVGVVEEYANLVRSSLAGIDVQ